MSAVGNARRLGGNAACITVLAAMMATHGCYLSHGLSDDTQPLLDDHAAVGEPNVPPAVPDVELPPCERELRMVEASSLPVDMLFVVDNSSSMAEEQDALAEQFPRLVQILTSGDLDADGASDFPRVEDLHLGVVSSDMGLVGVDGVPSCQNGLGHDGVLRSSPAPLPGCGGTYPQFLSYVVGADAAAVANDFRCIATLGTGGCGFEQPLEAGLKALWSANDERVFFLPDRNGYGGLGHGDDANAGFLRAESVLVIVVVTDEEDCSASDTGHFTPGAFLPAGDPLQQQPINLRCFYDPQNLYSTFRYVNGLRSLREHNPHLVLFAAIAGVPPDLVDNAARANVDFDDDVARDAYYQGILDDPRMVQRVDETEVEVAKRRLMPSCQTPTGKAFPPRRILEVARDFGNNGILQSICQEDFAPAMQALAVRLGETLTLAQCVD